MTIAAECYRDQREAIERAEVRSHRCVGGGESAGISGSRAHLGRAVAPLNGVARGRARNALRIAVLVEREFGVDGHDSTAAIGRSRVCHPGPAVVGGERGCGRYRILKVSVGVGVALGVLDAVLAEPGAHAAINMDASASRSTVAACT